jgi:hypothetical protein
LSVSDDRLAGIRCCCGKPVALVVEEGKRRGREEESGGWPVVKTQINNKQSILNFFKTAILQLCLYQLPYA